MAMALNSRGATTEACLPVAPLPPRSSAAARPAVRPDGVLVQAARSPRAGTAAGPPMTYATRGSRSRGDVSSGRLAHDQRHGAYATVTRPGAPASDRTGYRCRHSRKSVATQLGRAPAGAERLG